MGDSTNPIHEKVQEAIDELPEALRLPVILHYQEGLKYDEIAAVLDCPAGTVASRLSAARERLRKQLGALAVSAGFGGIEEALAIPPAYPGATDLKARIESTVRSHLDTMPALPAARVPRSWGLKLVVAGTLALLVSFPAWLFLRRTEPAAPGGAGAVARAGQAESLRSAGGPLAGGEAAGGAGGALGAASNDGDGAAQDLAPATVLYGWVRDDRGRPVPGAEVTVSGDGVGEGASDSTDENGSYAISIAAPVPDQGAVELDSGSDGTETPKLEAQGNAIRIVQALDGGGAGRPPRKGNRSEPDKADPPENTGLIVLEMASPTEEKEEEPSDFVDWGAPPRPLRFQISFSGGITFVNRLNFTGANSDGSQAERDRADQKPTFSVTVTVKAPGFLKAKEEGLVLEQGVEHELDFRLRPALSITGRTLDRTGTPIGGVEVKIAAMALAPDADPEPPEVRATTSDEQGRFSFDSLRQGGFVLRASFAGYLPSETVANAGGDAVVELTPVATMEVQVWHRTRSLPIRGARVEISGPGGFQAQAMTDDKGFGSFGELRGGPYRVSVHRRESSLASEEVVLAPGEAKTIEFTVTDGFAIEGRFHPSSEITGELQAAATRVDGDRRTSNSSAVDESGAFHFDGLPPGRYSIAVKGNRSDGPEGERVILAEEVVELSGVPGVRSIELVEAAEEPGSRPATASVTPRGQPMESAPVERTPSPKERGSLKPFVPDDGRLRILDTVSAASLLALLQRHSPGTIVSSLNPQAEEKARQVQVGSSGDFGPALEQALASSGLTWEIRNGAVYIEAAR